MSVLAGEDSPARAGLPANELLAPLPVLALCVLALNDWVLKPTSLPHWLTGKLSDLAGLFAFPLVATAAFDLGLLGLARLGVRVDYTLRRWKLATAIGLTLGVFTAMKLSPPIAAWIASLLSIVRTSEVMADPTDVATLVVLVGTWWYGRRVIARIPYGRLAWARATAAPAPFADAVACGADPDAVRALTAATASGDAAAIATAVRALRRGGTRSRS